MKILAHRGLWNSPEEKNSFAALTRAVEHGFGFESDVRDYRGRLVISHDIADENSPALEDVLKLLAATGDKFCFAINIKSDGLAHALKSSLENFRRTVRAGVAALKSSTKVFSKRKLTGNLTRRQSCAKIADFGKIVQ